MKILVTGANGYIGSKVVKTLLSQGIEVIATDVCDSHIDPRSRIVLADIFEQKENWFEFFGCPDVCLHLAWRDGFVHNSTRHISDFSAHFNFLKNMIDNGLSQLATMGTMHEVGYYEGAIDENTQCNPMSLYGISKNALRQALLAYTKDKPIVFQWLRGFYIFGDDEYGNSIFCKIRQAVRDGKELFPFTTGKNKYDFIHIDDLCEKISFCVQQKEVAGIINVCSGKPISLADMIEEYIKKNMLPIRLDYGKFPDRPYDSPCVYGDDKKISEIISKRKV